MNPSPIYRRVSISMWGDTKFSCLSPLPPSGQSLWLYLLTGPHTSIVPGVFVAGRAAMAEALGWDQRDFDAAMKELLDADMAFHEPRARLWFLPKAIQHNAPASPNVVRSWRGPLAVIPECELRNRILRELRQALAAASDAWVRSFDEALGVLPPSPSPNPSGKASPKPLVKASPKPSAKASPNQEQEQEQEHGSDEAVASSSSAEPTGGRGKANTPPCPNQAIVDAYHEALPTLPGVRLMSEQRRAALQKRWVWVLTSKKSDGTRRATTAAHGLEWFRLFFVRAADNDFVMGRTGRGKGHEGWQADLDYLLTDKGLTQVVEKTEIAA